MALRPKTLEPNISFRSFAHARTALLTTRHQQHTVSTSASPYPLWHISESSALTTHFHEVVLPSAHTAHAIARLLIQMTAATTPSLPVPSFDKGKMEDRKRSLAPDADDSIPRSKRIKEENGAPRMSAENEAAVEVSLLLLHEQCASNHLLTPSFHRPTRKTQYCVR